VSTLENHVYEVEKMNEVSNTWTHLLGVLWVNWKTVAINVLILQLQLINKTITPFISEKDPCFLCVLQKKHGSFSKTKEVSSSEFDK